MISTFFKLLFRKTLCERSNVIGGLNNILQPPEVALGLICKKMTIFVL